MSNLLTSNQQNITRNEKYHFKILSGHINENNNSQERKWNLTNPTCKELVSHAYIHQILIRHHRCVTAQGCRDGQAQHLLMGSSEWQAREGCYRQIFASQSGWCYRETVSGWWREGFSLRKSETTSERTGNWDRDSIWLELAKKKK